jgi:hypothetical protein
MDIAGPLTAFKRETVILYFGKHDGKRYQEGVKFAPEGIARDEVFLGEELENVWV